ncbi:MAG: molybdopterin-guanine dinucleotide biosynthesis protein B [Coriobacteriales bacterium]|nr:molybdopterin-guanine dinucleotide biosynthesis protein B [Coriobacteriales bacterium]
MTCPYINIVGWSGSGKTTLLTKITQLLTQNGLRVGVIKHHGHESGMVDTPGKDTYEYAKNGAQNVILSSSVQYAIFKAFPNNEPTQDQLIDEIADDCDLIIIEGFSSESPRPIVEVNRAANNSKPKVPLEKLDMLISDNLDYINNAKLKNIPTFSLDDTTGIANHFCFLCNIKKVIQ